MENSRLRHYLIVIGLLAVFSMLIAFTGEPRVDDSPGVRIELPDRIDDYTGESLRYCQGEQCLRSFPASALHGLDRCPSCGAALDGMSLAEKRLLPADTVVLKRIYANTERDRILVSMVVTGRERRSIHKPQICLKGQGYTIVAQHVQEIPVGEGDELGVMFLDLLRAAPRSATGEGGAPLCYAYWFVCAGRRTPHHFQRLLGTAVDGVLHNTRRRWAYIAVASERRPDSDAHVERISRFISRLAPLLEPDSP